MIKRREIGFEAKDWKGRTVTLLKSTIKNHVALYHFDELFVVDQLKRSLPSPVVVVWNYGAKSEQAVYRIAVGGHPYLQANIKDRGFLKRRLIVTFYGISAMPNGKVIYGTKPLN